MSISLRSVAIYNYSLSGSLVSMIASVIPTTTVITTNVTIKPIGDKSQAVTIGSMSVMFFILLYPRYS